MKKNYFIWFAVLAFLMFGCRQEVENLGKGHDHNHLNQRWNKTRILKGKEAEPFASLLNQQLQKSGSKFLARNAGSGRD